MRRAAPLFFCFASLAAAQNDVSGLMAAGDANYMRGDYETARQSFADAWDLVQQTPRDNPERYDVLKRLTSVRAAAGEFGDADNYLQMAINWRENTLGQDDPRIAADLLQAVGLCRGMKDYSRGMVVLNRVLGLHARAGGYESKDVADDYSRMAQLQLDQKKPENAPGPLEAALEIRTKLAGPLDPSLISDLDRLGGVYVTLRAYDKAEQTYRHALVIRETLFGNDHADLIATVDGLAYACFGQKKYDQAEPLYQRLLALWAKHTGEDHPMMAITLDKVAAFYAEQKKYDQAREAADHATAIRAHFLAMGLTQQATEAFGEGNRPEAIALWDRAVKVLDPPNPVYDGLRAEIQQIQKTLAAPPVRKKTVARKN
jgi:tetratricopeptide (TPR) repeat protein